MIETIVCTLAKKTIVPPQTVIPDCVLLKPGRLSDHEFDIMKSHTLLGAQTLDAALENYPTARFLQIARDIALALGTVGHVTMLQRTKAGPFTLDAAISLDNLHDAANDRSIAQLLLPLTAGLDDIPAFAVTADQAAALQQGRTLTGTAATTGLHLAILGETPVALVEAEDHVIRVVRGFNLMSKEEDR